MKNVLILTTATLALVACNKESGSTGELPVADAPVESVAAPDGQNWTDVVAKTDAGGYLMGNPDAPVKLVEYGSMTCGACAFFSANGEQQLKEEYLDSGRVSFEFRNYTRDPIDVTASLLARCGGENRFFPLMDAMFASQQSWYGQQIPQLREIMPQIQSLPPTQQFARLAEATGLKTFAVQRGLPASQADACLADEAAVTELVSIQSVGQSDFGVNRTPFFLINGVPAAEVDADYANLKPVLQRALGEEVTDEAAE